MTAPPRDSSTVRVCPVRDIVCSTPNECDQRETGCMMLINLPPELDHLRATPAPSAPVICHAPGDKCFGCDHYHGRAARCSYAPPAAQPADQPINEGRPAREQGPTTESADARLPDKGSAAASGAVAGARRSDDPTPSPAAQPAEPVVLQVTPGSSPPADCVDDGVQWFCPHCNPCRGGPLCRKPAEPTATDDLPTMDDAIAAGDGTLHGAIDYWQGVAQRQAREIERWRNVTARADPDDCAAGIKELYGRWKDAEAERDALRECVRAIVTAYDGYRRRGVAPAPVEYADVVTAIDAARAKVRT